MIQFTVLSSLHSLHLYLFADFGIAFRFQLYCLALCTDSFHRTDQPLSFLIQGLLCAGTTL